MKQLSIPSALTRTGGLISASVPRALSRAHAHINAAAPETGGATDFKSLNDALHGFMDRHNSVLDNVVASMGEMQQRLEMGGGIGTSTSGVDRDPEYSRAFSAHIRKGDGVEALKSAYATGDRATVQAALSVGSDTDGGYLAPSEWDRNLLERQRSTSPMRRLALVQTTSVGAFHSLWNDDNWGSGWVGETALRPQTTSPSLAPIPFAAGEIYANVAATQRLLDDAAINAEAWLVQSFEREFSRQENVAFIAGNGVNKPNGLLSYVPGGVNAATHPGGALGVVEDAIDYDGLVDFSYSLDAVFRQNSTWLMSSLTAAAIAKLKDANGLPIWREGLIVGSPATLLGRPVEIDEGMPGPAAGNLAIAFGDFKAGYLINDRLGTRILRDPYTNKPFVNFYATKRVGAGVANPFAIRILKVAA